MILFAMACGLTTSGLYAQAPALSLYAAGSLRLAFDDIISLHRARTGTRIKQADLFITYCTNAVATAREVPGLTWVRFGREINVPSAYTIGATQAGGRTAVEFVSLVLSPDGQAIPERYGFK